VISAAAVEALETQAVRVAPAARVWLRSARPARLLHVFHRAAYLIDDRGRILLLAAEPVGMGPFSLLTHALNRPLTAVMSVGAPARVARGCLTVGRLSVGFEPATAWSPTPDWPSLRGHLTSLPTGLAGVREVLLQHGCRGIFAALLTNGAVSPGGFDAALERRARSAATTLQRALQADDESLLTQAGGGLGGLGKGFTPSGDDYLLGAMFALWATRPRQVAGRLAKALARGALARTTPASAAWLAAAARGEAGEPWHGLFASLADNRFDGLAEATRRILRTGHTSGEDALIGFMRGAASLSTPMTA
jgi:hypothetical protein